MTEENYTKFATILSRLDERTDNMQQTSIDIKQWIIAHELKDDGRFLGVDKRLAKLQKLVYIGFGIMIAVQSISILMLRVIPLIK